MTDFFITLNLLVDYVRNIKWLPQRPCLCNYDSLMTKECNLFVNCFLPSSAVVRPTAFTASPALITRIPSDGINRALEKCAKPVTCAPSHR